MNRTRTIAMICLVALCAGCGSRPKINRLSESSVVVAFGDSLTSGTGANPEESYPAVLAELLACRVVNAGVAGEKTAAGLARLPAVLENERPDLVILCHGGNDLLSGQDTSITMANLNAMIGMVKSAGADVILIAVPRPSLFLKPAPFYQEIAASQGVPLEEQTLSRILSTPALTSDPVHPNAAGYKRLAASIHTLIRKNSRG